MTVAKDGQKSTRAAVKNKNNAQHKRAVRSEKNDWYRAEPARQGAHVRRRITPTPVTEQSGPSLLPNFTTKHCDSTNRIKSDSEDDSDTWYDHLACLPGDLEIEEIDDEELLSEVDVGVETGGKSESNLTERLRGWNHFQRYKNLVRSSPRIKRRIRPHILSDEPTSYSLPADNWRNLSNLCSKVPFGSQSLPTPATLSGSLECSLGPLSGSTSSLSFSVSNLELGGSSTPSCASTSPATPRCTQSTILSFFSRK